MVLGLQMTQERLTNALREYTKYRRNNCMMYSYSGIRNAYYAYLAYLYKFYVFLEIVTNGNSMGPFADTKGLEKGWTPVVSQH